MDYQHGGDVYSREIEIDYSVNINPLGLPEGVERAIKAAIGDASIYPDSQCRRLKAALSASHAVPEDALICGNGAADLLFTLALAVKPGRALLPAPSFLEYGQALKTVNCEIEYLRLKEGDGFCLDMKSFKEKIKEDIDIVFLCNPNNPTGVALRADVVEEAAAVCLEAGALLAVDECFVEFLDQPKRYSVMDRLAKYPNIFLLRAFTKLYAMAGVRLGYGVAFDRRLIERMEACRQPWSVSGLAQAAGEAALMEVDYLKATATLISGERRYLKNGLGRLGFKVFDSRANFIFFKDERKNAERRLYEECLRRKILIRSCHNYEGLGDGFYRICVKDRPQNKKLMGILEELTRCDG